MRWLFIVGSLILPLLTPALSQAANLCLKDNFGNTYTLIKPACRATSAHPAAVIGTTAMGNALQCQGSNLVGVHGVCFGVPSEGKVHLNLVSERSDVNNVDECRLLSWNLVGADLSSLAGTTEAPVFGDFKATTFSSIPCP